MCATLSRLLVIASLAVAPRADAQMAADPMPDAAADAQPAGCTAPDAVVTTTAAFPAVAAALAGSEDLDVLAIGSATMAGPHGAIAGSFPFRMTTVLRTGYRESTIHLTVHTGRGATAAATLGWLKDDLLRHRYQLVLWQTGTVEAARALPATAFRDTLSEGVAHVRAANAELVLIDPQYSRMLETKADLEPYLAALRTFASAPNVALFRRYELTKRWVGDGAIDLERTPRPERDASVNRLNVCLADALARLVDHAAGNARR